MAKVKFPWDAVVASTADESVTVDLAELEPSQLWALQHACLVALGETDETDCDEDLTEE